MQERTRLLIDISELVQKDSKTGIQRVVRGVLHSFLAMSNPPFRMIPVYSVDGSRLLRADAFTKRFLAKKTKSLKRDPEVQPAKGDIYLGLDLTAHLYPMSEAIIERLQEAGVTICHVVYDLTPLQKRAWHTKKIRSAFRPWFNSIVAASQQVICISEATKNDVEKYIAEHKMRKPRNQRVDWFHLGCDIEQTKPSRGLTRNSKALLRQLSLAPTLLMVGTIEPRKGHAQVLKACDILWRRGQAFNLCVVGKPGWNSEKVQKQIAKHRLLNKKLFWIPNASDEYLRKVYRQANALLNASEAEGFGLPMIEAAINGMPIIARDLPVNREICKAHAFYFRANDAPRLAQALTAWLQLHDANRAPSSQGLPVLTWRQSSRMLLKRILSGPRAIAARGT